MCLQQGIDARWNLQTSFTWIMVGRVFIFSVYAFLSLPIREYEALLTRVIDKVKGKRPAIVAGDFNT